MSGARGGVRVLIPPDPGPWLDGAERVEWENFKAANGGRV
jgi:hypothetical protein